MDNPRIIHAPINRRRFAETSPITQYDYGYLLLPEGVELPATYEIDFSNDEHKGTSLPVYGNAEGAEVPEELIRTGKDIYAFYYRVGEGFGKTEFTWRIPNHCRPSRDGQTPTPTQQSSIDQLIVRSNEAVTSAEQSASAAGQSAQNASQDAGRAEQAKTDAETAQRKAEEAQGSAERAKDDAETSERNASESERKAKGYAETASEKADSIHSMTAQATTLPDGSSATASYDAETGVMLFGIPKGKDGIDGDDGYSPAASVTKSGKVATITITDKEGTTSAQVRDGEDGIDGISPSVSVTDITGGHRIVITDKDGTESFDVEDGATGATPNLTIGTVETLEPTESATATITGTPENPVLNLGIPQGEQGEVSQAEFDEVVGDVNQLKSGLSEVKNEVMTVTTVTAPDVIEWKQGNIKPNDGGTSSSTARIRTNGYIPDNVSKLTVTDSDYKLLVYGYTASGTYVGMWDGTSISAYSSSKQYMYDKFDMDDAGDYKIKVVLRRADGGDITPSEASKVSCSIIESIADTVDALSAGMTTLADAVYKDVLASDVPPTWKQGNFNASTGAGTTGTTTLITDGYLPETVKGISINNDYLFNVFAYNDDGSYVGLYDEASDTYKKTGWDKIWITVFDVLKQNPSGYKLRLRVKNSEQTTITADKAENLTYKVIRAEYLGSTNPCEYDWKYEACVFDKMLCIGDSLIAGGGNYPNITPDDSNATRTITSGMYSNPTCLSKYFGFVTTNWGISGATTRSWYNSKSAENWGGYDSALIYIGSNDYNYVTTDGMTIEEGANLSETMLRNIIAKLKADNAGIRIFLCTLLPTTTTGSYAQYRIPLMEKIRTIASDTSGVFLIDLNTYSSFKSNSAYSNGHPTAIGYQWMSREIGAYMCWWISHYPNEFKWIRWIGTKYAVTGTAPDGGDDDGGYGGDVQ